MFGFENIYPKKIPLIIKAPVNDNSFSKKEEDLLSMNLEYIKENTWQWDPSYKGYQYVEKNKIIIQEKNVSLSQVARFKDVVNESSPLINLSLLSKDELVNYIGVDDLFKIKKNDDIILT